MTAKAALCKALIKGRIINVKNCFEDIGLTNCGREIPRMVEIPFGVKVKRTRMKGRSRFGTPITWFNYQLPKGQKGISEMKKYINNNIKK